MAYKYQQYFDDQLSTNSGNLDAYAASNFGLNYYDFHYPLMGVLGMFEATRELVYLTRVLNWCTTMANVAQILDTAGRRNWSGTWTQNGRTNPDVPIAFQLEQFQGATEMARAARIVLTDQHLSGLFGAQATAIKNFVRDHILDKELTVWGSGPGFDALCADVTTCYSDKASMACRIMMDLYLMGETQYLSRITAWNQGLLNRLHIFSGDSTCLIWDDEANKQACNDGPAPDTAHANRMIAQMVDALDMKLVFTFPVVFGTSGSIGNLFQKVIWDGNTSAPGFTNYINGSNASFRGGGPWTNGIIWLGFNWLGRNHAGAQAAGEAMTDCLMSGSSCASPSKQFYEQFLARMPMAGVATRNQASRLSTRRRELWSERGVTRGVAYLGT